MESILDPENGYYGLVKKPYPSENGIPPMTARERAFAAELRGETPVRRYAPGNRSRSCRWKR